MQRMFKSVVWFVIEVGTKAVMWAGNVPHVHAIVRINRYRMRLLVAGTWTPTLETCHTTMVAFRLACIDLRNDDFLSVLAVRRQTFWAS